MRILFLYLNAFSFTGGIEKFNRCLMKALHELTVEEKADASVISLHDGHLDESYFFKRSFTGLGGNRIGFICRSILHSFKVDTVILGHINLAIVGCLIKWLRPSVKVILITHGIEVWKSCNGFKKKILEKVDFILSVSQFTKDQALLFHPYLNESKIYIFPNAIEPHFKYPQQFDKPAYLKERYGISDDSKVLLTITRLVSSENYKGCDAVIKAMNVIKESDHTVVYLLGGKADSSQHALITSLIKQFGLENKVQMIGFIPDEELIDHYLLSDVFVMPSKGEGFGIVFIEALACGRKVIAGSKDGAAEALLHGELGILVDPDSTEELVWAIQKQLRNEGTSSKDLQDKVISVFGFDQYKQRLIAFCN